MAVDPRLEPERGTGFMLQRRSPIRPFRITVDQLLAEGADKQMTDLERAAIARIEVPSERICGLASGAVHPYIALCDSPASSAFNEGTVRS